MNYKVQIDTKEALPDGTPLVRSFAISGRVTDMNNHPVPNADIKIIEPYINDIGVGKSNADGTFMINVGDDTMHQIWINGVQAHAVKVLTKTVE